MRLYWNHLFGKVLTLVVIWFSKMIQSQALFKIFLMFLWSRGYFTKHNCSSWNQLFLQNAVCNIQFSLNKTRSTFAACFMRNKSQAGHLWNLRKTLSCESQFCPWSVWLSIFYYHLLFWKWKWTTGLDQFEPGFRKNNHIQVRYPEDNGESCN